MDFMTLVVGDGEDREKKKKKKRDVVGQLGVRVRERGGL